MLRRGPASRLRAEQDGFTLIELMVSMTIGLVVLGGALALMDVGARSSTRTADRTDVTQRGRVVLAAVQRRLRSQVCLDQNTPPIVSGDASSITYYTDSDADAYFRPEIHRIAYASDWQSTGRAAIVEYVTTPDQTSVQGPPWTYSQPAKPRVLSYDVTLQPSKPFLSYYAYDDANTPADEGATQLTVPLNSAITGDPVPANSRAKVVRVDVAFRLLAGRQGDLNGAGASRGTQNDLSRAGDSEASVYARNSDYTDVDSANKAQRKRIWGPRCD